MAFAEDGGIEIGLDYRFRLDLLDGKVHDYVQFTGNPLAPAPTQGYDVKNDTVFMNRFGVNLKANPVEDVNMKARLIMYKVAGHQSSSPILGQFFADRFGATNDGTVGHVPEDSVLRVDYAYATVSNIFDAPVWFSVGRRPSTGGLPSNYRQNDEKQGTAGIPSLMVNYAFDGMTLGYAPDIDALPGAYVKLCYGRGFDSGFRQDAPNSLKDTDFYGLNAALYDSEDLHVELQYQLGKNIFDVPSDGMTVTAPAMPGYDMTLNVPVSTTLGDISWIGGVVTGKVGSVNLFATAAMSKTDPNGNTTMGGMASLMNDGPSTESHKGSAFYVGGRYDMASTGTKIGVEYNHGSKNWVGMVPAEDDIWTSKLGTRGDVYEIYVIQSLNRKAVAKKGEAFVRLGYQLYKFEYTGSNNWVGAPHKISDLSTSNVMVQQFLAPVEEATDIYLTFDVRF
jgi:hypothetical protein